MKPKASGAPGGAQIWAHTDGLVDKHTCAGTHTDTLTHTFFPALSSLPQAGTQVGRAGRDSTATVHQGASLALLCSLLLRKCLQVVGLAFLDVSARSRGCPPVSEVCRHQLHVRMSPSESVSAQERAHERVYLRVWISRVGLVWLSLRDVSPRLYTAALHMHVCVRARDCLWTQRGGSVVSVCGPSFQSVFDEFAGAFGSGVCWPAVVWGASLRLCVWTSLSAVARGQKLCVWLCPPVRPRIIGHLCVFGGCVSS